MCANERHEAKLKLLYFLFMAGCTCFFLALFCLKCSYIILSERIFAGNE